MSNGRLKTASLGPAFLGAIVLFCAFAAVAWILFRFAAPSETYEEKRAQGRRDKVAAINAEAQAKLYSPAKWIDKAKGTVQLPIDTAMDLVVADYQGKPVQPSQVKVDNPYPAGLMAAPAPAASPAPAAAPGSLPKPAPAKSAAPMPMAIGAAAASATPTPSPEVKH